ncbi:MAG: hypothetical protein QOE16_819 [Microbacteriaceae bacterium]|jgi:amino acid transporter|nr:hypothetical protein [Microbacteriaceae bacterium]
MTESPPPTPLAAATPARLPFSKWTIWGFVLACISLFVFGFLGAIGVVLSARGFRDARRGIVRGRGLAIAGIIVGLVGFVFYAINFIIRTH